MRVFDWNGIIFNADRIVYIQKIDLDSKPRIKIMLTINESVIFEFAEENERNEKYKELFSGMKRL